MTGMRGSKVRVSIPDSGSYLMRVDAHVSDGASQVLVLAVVDVAAGLRVDVLLGQAEVHHVDDVPVAVGETTHQTVFRLRKKDTDEFFPLTTVSCEEDLVSGFGPW